MPGTKIGGLKVAQKIKERDPDFYKRIGSAGGTRRTAAKGFGTAKLVACDCGWSGEPHRKTQCAGAKGGRNKKGFKAGGDE